MPWTATNTEHTLTSQFVTEDGRTPALPPEADAGEGGIGGEMRFNIGRPPQATSGQDQLVPFAFNFSGLPLAETGRYVVTLALDATEFRRLSFTVAQQQLTAFQGRPIR